MISRDLLVHTGAVTLAIVIVVGANVSGLLTETGYGSIAIAMVCYGLIFGGSHLYLALRGEDGLIPVDARWRYVVALFILLIAGAVLVSAGDRQLGPIVLRSVAIAVIVVTTLGYVITESIAGYRASRTE